MAGAVPDEQLAQPVHLPVDAVDGLGAVPAADHELLDLGGDAAFNALGARPV
jgi:hypothetical protein